MEGLNTAFLSRSNTASPLQHPSLRERDAVLTLSPAVLSVHVWGGYDAVLSVHVWGGYDWCDTEILVLFCKRALQKKHIFCKETYIFKHPTNRSHPIWNDSSGSRRTTTFI